MRYIRCIIIIIIIIIKTMLPEIHFLLCYVIPLASIPIFFKDQFPVVWKFDWQESTSMN